MKTQISIVNRLRRHVIPGLSIALFACTINMPAYGGDIHEAAASGDLEWARALLREFPALANAVDESGKTPLFGAVRAGDEEMLELLLAYKVDINALGGEQGDRHTVLFEALDSLDMTRFLLAHHADFNARDDKNNTPLHVAVCRNSPNVLPLVLAQTADVNAKNDDGDSPLKEAVLCWSQDAVRALLAARANVNTRDAHGQTPLHMAAMRHDKQMALILLEHGAKVNAYDKQNQTPLDTAFGGIMELNEGDLPARELATLFLAHGATIKPVSQSKERILDVAVKFSDLDLAALLLKAGANPDAKNYQDKTPPDGGGTP